MWNGYKIKEYKTLKNVLVRNFTSMICGSFILEIWDKYCMHCGHNVKYGPFLKRLFIRKQQHGDDSVFELIENEKQSSNQVAPLTYTLEKNGFCNYFCRFVSCFFSDRVKKLVVYFGLYEFYLYF